MAVADVTSHSISITRRLVTTVLVLEFLSALILIFAVTFHEYRVELRGFDAMLTGTAQAMMGSVEDAEDVGDNLVLDLHDVRQLGKDAVYQVEENGGHVLGSSGNRAAIADILSSGEGFREITIDHRKYRLTILRAIRVIDPDSPSGGVKHNVTIVYGRPVGRVWHEVFEAIRFLVITAGLLLGVTAILMALLIRRYLSPVYQLADEANRINALNWQFDAPEVAKRTVELRPLARALEAALARVQLSFEQQKRFTSDAAHELKTDVAIVKSSLQLLSMKKRTADEYSRGLAISLDDFIRLETTVEKLLTLARLEQPPRIRDSRSTSFSCSIKKIIEEAVHQSSSFAQLKEIKVTTDLAEDAEIPLDRRDALLLCSNILVNAQQHSYKGGKVHISLSRQEDNVVLACRDWGEGIAEEDQPFLFDAFYRSDVSRSRKSGGTGLGLSICKAICTRVGGTIDISNHDGGGALVIVILPISKPPSVPNNFSLD